MIALQINSEAKFRKVFREGINKCFLMPAEFKDDAMRNFFRRKFEEFVNDSVNPFTKNSDHMSNFLTDCSSNASENADFAKEHTERCKIELEYTQCSDTSFLAVEEADVSMESPSEDHDKLLNDILPPISDNIGTLEEDGSGINYSAFNRE